MRPHRRFRQHFRAKVNPSCLLQAHSRAPSPNLRYRSRQTLFSPLVPIFFHRGVTASDSILPHIIGGFLAATPDNLSSSRRLGASLPRCSPYLGYKTRPWPAVWEFGGATKYSSQASPNIPGADTLVKITTASMVVARLSRFPSWVPESSRVVNSLVVATSFGTATVRLSEEHPYPD